MPLIIEPLPGVSQLAIDLGGIVPSRLAALSLGDIGRLAIRADERPVELGSLFRIRGEPATGRLECHGDFSRVHWIAAGMDEGEVVVAGPAGRHAGERMTGGGLVIHGDAGDWLACDMAGGTVHVAGTAGDNVAAALPGSRHGMSAGLVTVARSVGALAGARMRRGILAIGGNCGPAAAFELRAGTVFVGGQVGQYAGLGMQRGSLIAAGRPVDPPVTFRRGAIWAPTFMPLLAGRLERAGFQVESTSVRTVLAGAWQHWHGDLLAGGRGEIFQRAAA